MSYFLPRRFLLTALVGLGLSILRPLGAADAPAPSAPSQPAPEQPKLINIDFPGGTIAELITALRKDNAGAFNLIGEKADLATVLPAFSVRNAQPNSFATALDALLRPHGLYLGSGGYSQNGVFVVLRGQTPPASEVPKNAFLSIQLAPYLEAQSVDDIVGAIRAAWTLDPKHRAEDLRLQFHPATKLLLVSGPPQETDGVVRQVMGSLRLSASPAKENSGATAAPPEHK